MAIFYSAATNGFYPDFMKDDYVSAGNLPADVIEISDRWHKYLMNGQERGRTICANVYGQPVLVVHTINDTGHA